MENSKSESLREHGLSLLGDENYPASLNGYLRRYDGRGSKINPPIPIVLLAISIVANLVLLQWRQSLGLICRSRYGEVS